MSKKERSCLFNGHVLNPFEFVFCGVILLLVGLFILMVGVLGYLECLDQMSLEYNSLDKIDTIISIDNGKSSLEYTYFIDEDKNEYYIPTKAILNPLDCTDEGGIEVVLVCDDGYVYEITDKNGNSIATFDNTMFVRLQINKMHCIISIALFALIIVLLISSTYILSNAPKYPQLASLLVKKGSRNW